MGDDLGNTGIMFYNPDNGDEEEFAQRPLQIPNTDRCVIHQHQGFESQTQGGQLNNNGMMMLSRSVIKMICNIGFISFYFDLTNNSNQDLFLIIT